MSTTKKLENIVRIKDEEHTYKEFDREKFLALVEFAKSIQYTNIPLLNATDIEPVSEIGDLLENIQFENKKEE